MASLADIAQLLNCPAPPGAPQQRIAGVATLAEASPEDLTFITSERYLPQLHETRAAAVIVQEKIQLPLEWKDRSLRVADPELALSRVLGLFAPPVPAPPAGIDPAARVAASASVAQDAAIGPFVVIGQRARVGRRTMLHPGVVLGDDVTVGENCQIFPNVVVRERITIGNRVIIHAGSVLGSDGFGYRWDGSQHQKVPHIGTVVVEDDVEIGSCVCIDRAKMGVTRIGRGSKIDNLVQVAHNVQIGPHCIVAGLVGLAGSCQLGAGVVLGGQVAVRDHVKMGDGSMAAACTGVAEDVEPKAIVSGTPAIPHRQSLREQAALRHLPDLRAQVRKLEADLERLRQELDSSTAKTRRHEEKSEK